MRDASPSLHLGDMPLYWRVRERVDEVDPVIPQRTDFSFTFDAEQGLVQQTSSPQLRATLRRIYEAEHNVGYLQDGHMFSKGYGDDLLEFIRRTVSPSKARRVLEIGCGGCYLLERLARDGFDVTGVDPSPIAAAKGAEKGIKVVPDFYPSAQATGCFDVVLHADVLEHVEDPIGFLKLQRDQVSKDGILIISTPDCTQSIELGDVSMALHQHLNYFNEDALAHAVTSAGFRVLAVERARFGGSLYCSAVRSNSPPSMKPPTPSVSFTAKAGGQVERFRTRIDKLLRAGRKIGFYMPLRAMPYLAHLRTFSGLRLFDDTAHWHRQYFDGVDVPVENFEDFRRLPVDDVFVMSLTFGGVVESKLAELKSPANITTLASFLSGVSSPSAQA